MSGGLWLFIAVVVVILIWKMVYDAKKGNDVWDAGRDGDGKRRSGDSGGCGGGDGCSSGCGGDGGGGCGGGCGGGH